MKMCGKIAVFILFVFTILEISFCQDISAYKEIKFNHLNNENVMPDNIISKIVQDNHGFIWITTTTSLVRFNGISTKIYKNIPHDSSSLPTKRIKIMHYVSKDNVFYLGTDNGVIKFYPETERFDNLHNSSLPSFESHSIEVKMDFVFDSLLLVPLSGYGYYIINTNNDRLITVLNKVSIKEKSWPANLSFKTSDNKGNLWFGSANSGFYKVKVLQDTILVKKYAKNFREDLNIPIKADKVFQDSKGNLLFANNGLFKISFIDDEINRITQIDIFNSRYPKNNNEFDILDIIEDWDNKIWVSTRNYGIKIINIETLEIEEFKYNTENYNGEISNTGYFAKDKENNMWIMFTNNVFLKYDKLKKLYSEFKHNPSNPFSPLREFNASRFSDVFFQDNTGVYWLAGDQNGLMNFSLSLSKFNLVKNFPYSKKGLSGNSIWGIYEDSKENLFVGIRGWGLNIINRKTGEIQYYRVNDAEKFNGFNVLTSFLEISDNEYLFGSVPVKRFRLNTKTDELEFIDEYKPDKTDPESISSWVMLCMFKDSQGRVYLGSSGFGLDQYIDSEEKGYEIKFSHFKYDPEDSNSIIGDEVWHIMEDKHGRLWISTSSGISILDESRVNFTNYFHIESDTRSISSNSVRMTMEDRKGRIWIATEGGGLNLYDKKTDSFICFDSETGFPSNNIYCVYEDGLGNLWCSSEKGVIKFDPKTEESILFYKDDGLQGNQFFAGSHYQNIKGNLFFGGANGFNSFLPDSIRQSELNPTILFTNLMIGNQEVSANREMNSKIYLKKELSYIDNLELSYKENIFSIEFAALDYSAPKKIKYLYKIDGINEDWVATEDNKNKVYFTNLPHGKYLLRVRSTNSDGIWCDNESQLQIEISPPWWKTILFYIFVITLTVLIVILLIKYRESQLKKDQEILQSKLEEGDSEIRSQKNKLKVQEEELLKKIEKEKLVKWHTNGLIKFSSLISDNRRDARKLAQKIIVELLSYIGGEMGAIYFLNDIDDRQTLNLMGGYALDKNHLDKEVIEIGEGLVGTCFKTKKVMQIDNLSNDYAYFSSGLGIASIANLILLPIMSDSGIEGVIEILSFKKIEDYKMKFIKEVSNTLSSVLSSVRDKQKIESILDESKKQRNELYSKEMELRRNLEELSAIQEQSNRREEKLLLEIEELKNNR